MESYNIISFETNGLVRLDNKRKWKVHSRLCDLEKWLKSFIKATLLLK